MTRDEITRAARDDGGMFAIIPAIVMRDAALSMSARMLYGVLTWRSNRDSRCWPTNRELGEDLGLSPKRISVLLALLEERGHIEMEVVREPPTGLLGGGYLHPVETRGGVTPKHEHTPPRDRGDPPPENEEVIGDHKRDHKPDPPIAPQGGAQEPEQKKRTPRRAVKTVPAWEPERFEGFWSYYPRHENRAKAAEEWDRLRPDGDLIRAMGLALQRQKASEDWQRGIGIPHACRWLKNRRWLDEPPGGGDGSGGVALQEGVPTW